MRVIGIGLCAVALVARGAPGQERPVTLELVFPDASRPVQAPVSVLVWRLAVAPDSAVWSFRVGERDVSTHAVRRGREFLVALPAGLALGPGRHRLTGDVCLVRGPCAGADVMLDVRGPALRAPSGTEAREFLLETLLELLRRLLPGS